MPSLSAQVLAFARPISNQTRSTNWSLCRRRWTRNLEFIFLGELKPASLVKKQLQIVVLLRQGRTGVGAAPITRGSKRRVHPAVAG